jgi:hypothetical protein
MANELGSRNVAFEVNDLQAAVGWAVAEGYGLVGGIGEYEGAPGGWPTSAGRKGSSSHWPSASAEPRNARSCTPNVRTPGVRGRCRDAYAEA